MSFFGKEFKFEKAENFEAYLKAAVEDPALAIAELFSFLKEGVPAEGFAKSMQFKPVVKLEKDGDTYTYSNTTPEKSTVLKFKSGEELEGELGNSGHIVKSTYIVDGNTLTQVTKSGDKETTFKREFSDSGVKVTITANFWDGVAYRYYKA